MKTIFIVTMMLALPAVAVGGERDAVAAAIAEALPGVDITSVSPSPVAGLSEVVVDTEVVYVTDDGLFFVGGPLVATRSGDNLTERRVAAIRRDILAGAPAKVFRYPAEKPRFRITVFTDIDCPYCRRLHKDLPEFRRLGIDVNYVMLPRSGKGSPSYRKTVNAACAAQPEAAITAAMLGNDPDSAICEHPIDEHLALARRLRLSSTPSIVLPDGRLVLGQKSAEQVLALLGEPATPGAAP